MAIPEKPTLTTPPAAPIRGQDPTVFANRANAYVIFIGTNVSDLAAAIDWQNTVFTAVESEAADSAQSVIDAAAEVALAADQVALATGQVTLAQGQVALAAGQVTLAAGQVTLAQTAATLAASSANFKGEWSSLTGSLNVPAVVLHSEQYWQLLVNLSNVTSAEPGISASWAVAVLGPDYRRAELLEQATLSSDFANNKYEVYEGPVDGLTQMPFNTLWDFTRASGATARTATQTLATVTTDQQRLIGNREGLLIEEARTNLALYSEQFDNSAWVKNNSSISANEEIAPSGTTTADKLSETTTNAQHFLDQFGLPTSSGFYTQSIFLKSGTITNTSVMVVHIGESSSDSQVNINLSLGTISGPTRLVTSTTITALANGWFRASLTYELTGVATDVRMRVFSGLADSRIGSTANFIYIWGAQAEQGSFATSYIPTTSAQVTRAADACERLMGGELNKEAFSFYYEFYFDKEKITGNPFTPNFSPDTGNGSIRIRFSGASNASAELQVVRNDSSVNIASSSFNLTDKSLNRISASFTPTKAIVCANGTLNTFTLTGAFTNVDRLTLGDQNNAGRSNTIQKDFRLFPKALSEAELIILTGGA